MTIGNIVYEAFKNMTFEDAIFIKELRAIKMTYKEVANEFKKVWPEARDSQKAGMELCKQASRVLKEEIK